MDRVYKTLQFSSLQFKCDEMSDVNATFFRDTINSQFTPPAATQIDGRVVSCRAVCIGYNDAKRNIAALHSRVTF